MIKRQIKIKQFSTKIFIIYFSNIPNFLCSHFLIFCIFLKRLFYKFFQNNYFLHFLLKQDLSFLHSITSLCLFYFYNFRSVYQGKFFNQNSYFIFLSILILYFIILYLILNIFRNQFFFFSSLLTHFQLMLIWQCAKCKAEHQFILAETPF